MLTPHQETTVAITPLLFYSHIPKLLKVLVVAKLQAMISILVFNLSTWNDWNKRLKPIDSSHFQSSR